MRIPSLYLTDDVPFELEMVVENGRGYVPASEHSPDAQEIGIIPVVSLPKVEHGLPLAEALLAP